MNCNIRRYASRVTVTVAVAITFGLVAAGCGPIDDDSSKEESIDQFTGTWEYDAGTLKFTCNGETTNTEVSGNMTISESASADLLVAQDGCNWDFNVSDHTADVVPGQECEIENDDGTTSTLEPTDWTLDVDGNSMTETVSGLVTVETSRGDVDCDVQGSGSLTKRGE